MNQSKLESLIESFLNIGSGFVISMLLWVFLVAPVMGIPPKVSEAFFVTLLFTSISVLRSYIWRRLFNNRIPHMIVEKYFKKC